MSWGRTGLVVGGAACLLVTPFLALAYYPAFGSAGEAPPPWADWVAWPELVGGDAVAAYNAYGTVFGVALLVVTVSLASLIRASTTPGSSVRSSWNIVAGGLGAVAIGSILEYGFEILPGFLLELTGFLVLIAGATTLGSSLRKEAGAGRRESLLVGASGFAAVAVGAGLVGHLPSGPALVPVGICAVIGLTGLPFAVGTTEARA
jgi:hypothetical protein